MTIDQTQAFELYRMMYFIRRYEELARSLFQRGAIQGSIHLCMGQEAVPVGVCSALGESDVVAATYRGHGQALALGVDPTAFLAELLGRRGGVCGGRAGSMNVVDLEHRLIGSFGIVGGSIAAATGAALALKRQGDGVAVAFFGDGGVNQAYFHECLNLAALQHLPVVYVCENNGYMEFTPTSAATAGEIIERPRAMGIDAHVVDGQDVLAVRDLAESAISAARRGEGPVFIEALTYRYNDHARGDPVQYRPEGEMEAWLARDPLDLMRNHLVDEFGFTTEVFDSMMGLVEAELEVVRDSALASPPPDPVRDQGSEFCTQPRRVNA
jgi:TPP-dependent pyruvate/acetoin dehydrogenase alpha subunit